MSDSDNEYPDLNYGIDEDFGKSFAKTNAVSTENDTSQNVNDEPENDYQEDIGIPKFEKNPKTKKDGEDNMEDLLRLMEEQDEVDDGGMEELLNLLAEDNDDEQTTEKQQENERTKVLIKKEVKPAQPKEDTPETPVTNKTKSTITITKIQPPKEIEETAFIEKKSGLRLVKTNFKSESDMNLQLASSYGKFYKLTELNRYMFEIKNQGAQFDWFSIFVISSKSDTKKSAKGNAYCIWSLCDIKNLEKQQDLSLFLFGIA
jgi:hypothetical protein